MLYGSIRFPAVGRITAAVTFHTVSKLGIPVTIVEKVNDSETDHSTSTGRGKQAGVNSVLIHQHYGSPRCPEFGRRTAVICVQLHTLYINWEVPKDVVH